MIFGRPLKRVLGKIIPFSKFETIHPNNLGKGTRNGANFLRDDGVWSGLPLTSYGLYAQTELGTVITNTIVETSLIGPGVGTLSVPPNSFKVGDSFTVKMCGNLSCANNETIHIRIKSDGTVIADAGVFQMKIATNKFFELIIDFTIAQIGGPGVGKLHVNGQYSYNQNSNTQLDGVNFALISNTVFDTTVLNDLSITAHWGSANVDNSIQSQNFVLQKVY
jgi:hypothetical protein